MPQLNSLPDDLIEKIYKIYYKNVINELKILNQVNNKRKHLKKNTNKLYTNESVVVYWLNGISHHSIKKDQLYDKYLFFSDGYNLYSCDILIGFTKNKKKYIYNYTASNNKFISYTCSRHINIAKRYCDYILN